MRDIDNTQDLIDVRDIIARVEELETQLEDAGDWLGDGSTPDEGREELATLSAFLADLAGNDGDEEWRGDWYPVTLVRDSYFKDYAQELAEDIGAIPADAQWPCRCIDWDKAAWELRMDYTSAEYSGVTYWYL